jgi:transglutaminase-like putative cysteine protease
MPKKTFWIKLSLFLAIFTVAPGAQAADDNFSSRYEVQYQLFSSGTAEVRQTVTITNLTSRYYVSSYSFTIGNQSIKDIKAWDPTGSLTPKVKRREDETLISLNFRARVLGVGKKLTFGISYKFPALAEKNGLVWNLNLLKITGLEDIKSYRLKLSVPKDFGKLLYSHPAPKSTSTGSRYRLFSYTKEELSQGPPRLAFGSEQLYHLKLTYYLENPSLGVAYTEIAFPADIVRAQQVILDEVSPLPSSIRVDADGNYLARYDLGPLEKKEVHWQGFIALFYQKRKFTSKKMAALPKDLVSLYTQSQDYWEVDDPLISSKADQLLKEKTSAAANARRIFDFVVKSLSYDYTKTLETEFERLGAKTALSKKGAVVCTEYTDLFIALARAAGFPAREINGFAYTANESERPLSLGLEESDVLHAWPEIYLPDNGWIMVDPTWSSTSGSDYFSVFDLFHISFVRKGLSSQYPLPAGSYKTDPSQKSVEVAFSSELDVLDKDPQLSVEVELPPLVISPFKAHALVKVKNTSNVAAFDSLLTIESSLLEIVEGQDETILGAIPPGGEVEVPLKLVSENFRVSGEERLTIQLAATDFRGEEVTAFTERKTTVNPLYFPLPLPYLAAFGGAIVLSVYLNRFLFKKLRS